MLTLVRKCGQSIHIENVGTITIVKQSGKNISLAFDMPPHVRVHRAECVDRLPKPPAESVLA